MPKAKDVEWTRELLERVLHADTDEVWALCEELGVTRATIYSKRGKIRAQGFEAAMRKRRNHPRKQRPPQTVKEELNRIYVIHKAKSAGRGDVTQYTVTIPARLGETFIERFNTAVRFMPVEQGLLIIPLERWDPDQAPAWLPPDV